MKHTPGPWVAKESKKPIRGAVSRTVINIEGPHKMPIAICHGAISRVDAQLIAAAPDLLKALKSALDHLHIALDVCDEEDEGRISLEDAIDRAEKAIAKARGEP